MANTEKFRIYILGPMRGIPWYNFPKFDEVAERLEAAGFTAVNPAELDREHGFDVYILPSSHDWTTLPDTLKLDDIIDRDVKAVRSCWGYVCIPGWERSRGACAEKALLDWAGAVRLDYNTLTPVLSDSGPSAPTELAENPKDRIGVTKPQLHLVPSAATIHFAKALENGASKYGAYNWRANKVKATVYISAALRHLAAYLDGEDIAEDSGVHHAAHAGACMAILLDALETQNLVDDRPAKGAASQLIKKMTVDTVKKAV